MISFWSGVSLYIQVWLFTLKRLILSHSHSRQPFNVSWQLWQCPAPFIIYSKPARHLARKIPATCVPFINRRDYKRKIRNILKLNDIWNYFSFLLIFPHLDKLLIGPIGRENVVKGRAWMVHLSVRMTTVYHQDWYIQSRTLSRNL